MKSGPLASRGGATAPRRGIGGRRSPDAGTSGQALRLRFDRRRHNPGDHATGAGPRPRGYWRAGNDVFAPALPVTETFTIIGPTITGIHPAGSSAATIQAGSWASIYGN